MENSAKKKKSLMELIRYGFSGVSIAIVNLAIYHFFMWLGVDYKWSNLIALVVSKTYGYLMNKLFVFRSHCKDFRELMVEILSFIAARGFTGLVDYFGLIFFVEVCGMGKFVSKYLLQVIVIVLNYILGKFMVFRKKKPAETEGSAAEGPETAEDTSNK